jgi:peroxiredoxin family protein
MPTETMTMDHALAENLLIQPEELDSWFHQKFEDEMRKHQENKTPSMTIIATKGTMDMAYPPFILASTAAALGWDVSIFFTFYGLELLKKDLQLKVSPLGNPAMPMKMPFGPQWLKNINMNIPNAISSNIPGFENMATVMMQQTTRAKGVASIEELRELSIEAGVNMVACQMTVDLFNYSENEFIDEVNEWVGAASFLPIAARADVSLFI